ncbi:MAG: lipoate--protein ligase family protein, partial [Solobacterium sp.]|nr:lipoate--protein ligase family protein [Solobacterium sp.]
MKLSYIETDCTNPYANLAMESALFETIEEDELILFLWQNEPSLIFGKNQNLWQECNLTNVQKDHVHLVRRPTGGGAVYHDLGNMNFTFLAKDYYFSIERNNTILLNALKKLDIDAEISGRNDLLVQNKKFSGHAYLHKSSTSLHHGTLLIHSDLTKMPLYLNVDQRKMKTKAVSSVKSRVINLQEIKPITLSDMKQSLRKSFEEEYGLTSFVKEEPPHTLITEFQKKYE